MRTQIVSKVVVVVVRWWWSQVVVVAGEPAWTYQSQRRPDFLEV